ncbi:MAG: hypothetical protein IPK13_26610 [Deltaproteobacteria bacterium]|nr:hypothetical protein [Deltaproteobacteria bacterium]
MLGTLLIIFAGGLVIDLLQTRYVASIAKGDRLRAAVMSGFITFGSLVLWGTLLQRAETLGLAGAGALALGAALGTLIGVWRRNRRCVDGTAGADVSALTTGEVRTAEGHAHAVGVAVAPPDIDPPRPREDLREIATDRRPVRTSSGGRASRFGLRGRGRAISFPPECSGRRCLARARAPSEHAA